MSRKPKVMSSAVRFNILTAIQHDDRLTTTARVVASILLLRYWNRRHRGRCNPAMETLAEDVGCARRSVCRAVEELKKLGWLSIIGTRGGHRQTNQYNFQMAKNIQNVSRKLNRYITSEEEINQQEQYDTPIVENSTVPNPVHTVTNLADNCDTGGTGILVDSTAARQAPALVCEQTPFGCAQEGASGEYFLKLYTSWREAKPHGVNEAKAQKAWREAVGDDDGTAMAILASAQEWLATVESKYLPKLEKWLLDGGWRNSPPAQSRHANSRPPSQAELMARAAGLI